MNEADHDTSATLEEVLAFIDACDPDKSASSTAQLKAVESRKSRSQVGHEIKRLRREAKYLEMRLKQLISGSKNDSETLQALKTNVGQSKWIQTVLEEYRRYRQSKRTNRELKALVAKQSQVIVVFKCLHSDLLASD